MNATRRCYQWGTARSDVCFVQRPDAATRRQAGARDAKAALSVADVEQMLWNVHASIMGDDPNGGVNDKYTDNHYAVDLQSSGDYLAKYWEAHNPFPITASTRVAYACKQSYLIDPTGWSIQVRPDIGSSKPSSPVPCRSHHLVHSFSGRPLLRV